MVEILRSRYQLLKKVGSGGSGEVYRAEDLRLGRPVAVKRVRAVDRGSRDLLLRLGREAENLARVNHPNVVALYDVLENDNSISLILEFVDGVHYRDLIRRRALGEDEVLFFLRQLLAAIAAIHAGGLVHRDVNPKNILVTEDRVLKLTDFGLAWRLKEEEPRSGGTLGYMAPEALRKGNRLGFGVDIYGAGMVAYQSLLGLRRFRRFYHTREPREWARWLLSREPFRGLKDLGVPVSSRLAALVSRMLEKDPRQRYQRASDVLEALEAADEARRRKAGTEPATAGVPEAPEAAPRAADAAGRPRGDE